MARKSRHSSWTSDTVIFGIIFVIVLIVTVLTDQLNGPDPAPAYLTGLLGAAGAALFGAAGSDKSKRDREVSATATRAESKADDALGRSDASMDAASSRVIDVQERELVANRAALQLMKDAIEVKESSGIPVLPETLIAIAQLERQTDLLVNDIHNRRLQMNEDARSLRERETETGRTAKRAEAKVDKLAEFAKAEHPDHGSDLDESLTDEGETP